ncbi:MAG: hypothetical protein Tsb0020_29870 [Haliangiales bacterium]
MRDYLRIVEVFVDAYRRTEGDAHLLFTGDLVHGPHLNEDEWPDFLGEYYRDQSGEVVEAFAALAQRYPGHVHALLGNHEHGHVGGPHTAKFAYDEVELLERNLGPARTLALRRVLRDLPLIAIAKCGAVFTHGAPAADIDSLAEIETAKLSNYHEGSPLDILSAPVIGPILWARSATGQAARRFLRAVGGTISIFGHDVIPEGFERIGTEQMVVSTSFGVFDSNKVYLDLNLGGRYRSVYDLRVGQEIRPLYPDKAPPSLGGHAHHADERAR